MALHTGRPISFISELSSLFSSLGKRRFVQKGMRKVRRHPLYGKDILVQELFYIDGSFAPAKKGGAHQSPTGKGKGTKIMVLTDEKIRAVSIVIASASIHEVKLVEQVIAERASRKKPKRITGDKAYDSDELDQKLRRKGFELNAPHRSNRRKPPSQDRRKLRAYRRRWKVERFFAWLFNFRRCASRYEYKAKNFKAFVLLASAIILIR